MTAESDMFLDVEDITSRYRIGRTKAYELVGDPDLPRSVVGNMTRIPLRQPQLSGTAGCGSSAPAATGRVKTHVDEFRRGAE